MSAKGRIIISGATGLIGREVTARLIAEGYSVKALVRDRDAAAESLHVKTGLATWDGESQGDWTSLIEGSAGVLNFAGDNIGYGRWSYKKKMRIRDSRTRTTRLLVEAVQNAKDKPSFFIQASAIGFYGSGPGEKTEDSPPGEGFLAEVVQAWEEEAAPLDEISTRKVILRMGAVFAKGGGVYDEITRPMRFKMGSVPGPGKNMVSWIHIQDLVEAVVFLSDLKDLSGVFNVTSPRPVSMERLVKTVAASLKKKAWFKIPRWMLYLALGKEKARELVLSDVNASPARLLRAGFEFKYSGIKEAAQSLSDLSTPTLRLYRNRAR